MCVAERGGERVFPVGLNLALNVNATPNAENLQISGRARAVNSTPLLPAKNAPAIRPVGAYPGRWCTIVRFPHARGVVHTTSHSFSPRRVCARIPRRCCRRVVAARTTDPPRKHTSVIFHNTRAVGWLLSERLRGGIIV